jgi:hypothetical protein
MRSKLAIYDRASASLTCVLKTDQLIEAPNWTLDVKALIINGDGHI